MLIWSGICSCWEEQAVTFLLYSAARAEASHAASPSHSEAAAQGIAGDCLGGNGWAFGVGVPCCARGNGRVAPFSLVEPRCADCAYHLSRARQPWRGNAVCAARFRRNGDENVATAPTVSSRNRRDWQSPAPLSRASYNDRERVSAHDLLPSGLLYKLLLCAAVVAS